MMNASPSLVALDDPNLGAREKLALLERLRQKAKATAARMEQHGNHASLDSNWDTSDDDDDDELIMEALRFKARQKQQQQHKHKQVPLANSPKDAGHPTVYSSSIRQREPGPTFGREYDSDEDECADAAMARVEPAEWYDEQSGEPINHSTHVQDQTLLEQTAANAQRQRERKRLQQAGKEWKDKLLLLSNSGQALEREVAALLRKPHHAAPGNEHTLLERTAKVLQRKRADDKHAVAHQTSRAKTAVALLRAHLSKPGSGELYLNKAKELAQGAEKTIDGIRRKFTTSYEELR
jgi:hypothetical protein